MESKQLKNAKEILQHYGISPSFHRLKIYEYMMDNRAHPTADSIFSEINKIIPTLSKTTIYNTLKTFMEKGIIHAVTIEDNEVRYDADISFHGHLKCDQCGSVYDIDLKGLQLDKKIGSEKKIQGHSISESSIHFKGICKKCQEN